jgi:hypothetical protein
MIMEGKTRSNRGENCPSATFSTSKLTWTDLELTLHLRGYREVTNRLNHDTALGWVVADEQRNKSIFANPNSYIIISTNHISIKLAKNASIMKPP